eukprot:TRINITY_DN557_c0_g1_i1.p1 TRINITY_DN557_c0_g1~~TRINITY_DN557_c0_g1_i1.p1  ORF type:complete len:462 (+),score=118.97 TRINITY_DN557_c0_g1_i1:144-1529(+)
MARNLPNADPVKKWKVDYRDLDFQERIGKGNFGEVWKGKYLGLDVAIKKLYFVDDDFMQKYIEREMDTLRGLNHPNIVQLMGLCTETGEIYIVTEFVPGGSLRQVLKNPNIPLSWSKRTSFARDIALAMTYLHHKDIMHRDLKSANLLVGADWRLKVCDFGLARKNPGEEENTITTVGTNEWMAPEVAMQEAYNNSADVFSYGMVLYEIITRTKPPKRRVQTRFEFDASKVAKNVIPADTPQELWNLMLDCANTDPNRRPSFPDVLGRLKDMNIPDDDSEDEYEGDPSKDKAGYNGKGPVDEDDADEESEEETTSYIARGREITEVNKMIKKPFRKPQFCRFECSIPKKPEWAAQADVPIKVRIENQSGKIVKVIKYWLQITQVIGKKKKIVKSTIIIFKGGQGYAGFPVKLGNIWEGTIPYSLPALEGKSPQDTYELKLEFTLAGGFAKKATAFLPIALE